MRAVNLLPADRVAAKAPSRLVGPRLRTPGFLAPVVSNPLPVGGGVAMVATIAGLVLLVSSANSSVASRQHQLAALNAQIAKLPAPPPTPTSAAGAPARLAAVTLLAQDRLPWDGFLGALSRVMPEDVWLSTLQANSPGAAAVAETATAAGTATGATTPGTTPPTPAPASPSVFTISGFTYSQPSVARLMRRLALVPWLSNVNLVSSSKTMINATPVYQFTVGANVIPLVGKASS